MTHIRTDTIGARPVCVRSKSVLVRTAFADGCAVFKNIDWAESDRERGRDREIHLANADWEDFGSPDKITVVIEPGDKLNKEQS